MAHLNLRELGQNLFEKSNLIFDALSGPICLISETLSLEANSKIASEFSLLYLLLQEFGI